MGLMRRQSLVKFDAPLCETIVETPKPQGREVLVRIERCGLCHSDLHIQDGYADLGGGKKLDTTRGMTLPFTLGHEIAGVIESAGDPVFVARLHEDLDRVRAAGAVGGPGAGQVDLGVFDRVGERLLELLLGRVGGHRDGHAEDRDDPN